MSWNNFEQRIWKNSKDWPPEIFLNPWVIAVSGGLDSIVLLHVMKRLSKALKINLEVIHFHHGYSSQPVQIRFRDKASQFVKTSILKSNLQFSFNEIKYSGKIELKSEAAFRSFRKKHIQELLKQQKVIAVGHHQDDLLETRIIRAIRGTGRRGLKSMNMVEPRSKEGGFIIRPLLEFTRKEIEQYAADRKLSWIDDPSNLDSSYLRNWLRNVWLPALEIKRPGSLSCLAKSMEHFAADSVVGRTLEIKETAGELTFSRFDFKNVTKVLKKQIIADVFFKLNVNNYTENHILEVIKRLDISRSRLTFQIAGTLWSCDAQLVNSRKFTKSADE